MGLRWMTTVELQKAKRNPKGIASFGDIDNSDVK